MIMGLKYPIYIITKGRADKPLTSSALSRMKIPHYLVIEPQEFEKYAATKTEFATIVQLPFSNLNQGSIPARNWCWQDSMKHERHWILDDNIEQFNRMNNNLQVRVDCDATFKATEDFVDRYENVGIAGFEYDFFCKSKWKWTPFRLNTRIYSCLLIDNNLPFRWRGKYNEDTDLSLRVLKSGVCTVLFLAFLQQKTQTMKMEGGNSDMYAGTNDRLEFAESLVAQHPDVARLTRKFGRWHHHVNYRPFKNNRLLQKNELPKGTNEFGMTLQKRTQPK